MRIKLTFPIVFIKSGAGKFFFAFILTIQASLGAFSPAYAADPAPTTSEAEADDEAYDEALFDDLNEETGNTPPENEPTPGYNEGNILPETPPDRLEPLNRRIYGFNLFIEKLFLRPVARAYRFALPLYLRDRIRNVVVHLGRPVSAVNSLLQGDIENMSAEIISFAFNSTIGVYGIFDFAGMAGVKTRDEDFGQTLGVYSLGPGSYLVLPFLGPSSIRDTTGLLVDNEIAKSLYEPVFEANNIDANRFNLTVGIIGAIDSYARILDQLEALEQTSLDPYASVRQFYYTRREAAIINLEEETRPTEDRGGGPNDEALEDALDSLDEEFPE